MHRSDVWHCNDQHLQVHKGSPVSPNAISIRCPSPLIAVLLMAFLYGTAHTCKLSLASLLQKPRFCSGKLSGPAAEQQQLASKAPGPVGSNAPTPPSGPSRDTDPSTKNILDAWAKGHYFDATEHRHGCWLEVVEGKLPAQLQGTFFRNGPGRFGRGPTRYGHPYDGDGLVASAAFTGGRQPRVWYRAAAVDTPEHKADSAAGRVLFRGAFGTQRTGPFANALDMYVKNASCTAVTEWNGRLMTTHGASPAYSLEPDTLDTVGLETLGGQLRPGLALDLQSQEDNAKLGSLMRLCGSNRRLPPELLQGGGDAVCARPRVDPVTGRMCLFTFRIMPRAGNLWSGQDTQLTFWDLDEAWNVVGKTTHTLRGVAYVHDMAVTPNYFVVFQSPTDFDWLGLLTGKANAAAALRWRPNAPTLVHIVPRPGSDAAARGEAPRVVPLARNQQGRDHGSGCAAAGHVFSVVNGWEEAVGDAASSAWRGLRDASEHGHANGGSSGGSGGGVVSSSTVGHTGSGVGITDSTASSSSSVGTAKAGVLSAPIKPRSTSMPIGPGAVTTVVPGSKVVTPGSTTGSTVPAGSTASAGGTSSSSGALGSTVSPATAYAAATLASFRAAGGNRVVSGKAVTGAATTNSTGTGAAYSSSSSTSTKTGSTGAVQVVVDVIMYDSLPAVGAHALSQQQVDPNALLTARLTRVVIDITGSHSKTTPTASPTTSPTATTTTTATTSSSTTSATATTTSTSTSTPRPATAAAGQAVSSAEATTLWDAHLDAACVNSDARGRRHRYVYGLSAAPSKPCVGLAKVDVALSGNAQTYTPPQGVLLNEPTFVPRPGAMAEDEGWLLVQALDTGTTTSELWVFDAWALAAGPVTRLRLPHPLPHGLHGCWSGTVYGAPSA